ncbi:MAG: SRPBCC family protein [Actinomycetota bacterium]
MAAPSHVYEIFIKATPAEVWTAITDPAFTKRYFHETAFTTDLKPGSPHRYVMANGEAAVDGVVEEVEPERRLVITWHVLYNAAMAEEPPGRVEWNLRPVNDDGTVTRVTLRHFDLGMSPLTSDNVALGWVGVIDSMKTLLETGESLGDLAIEPGPATSEVQEHRRLAVKANGETWDLLASDAVTSASATGAESLLQLLDRAHTSSYHWDRATEEGAVQRARAAWMLSRCYAVAGQADLAMRYADRCVALTAAATEAADFDVAYTHEALARAHALAGDPEAARAERAAAAAVAITGDEDRKIFEGDLETGPWFGLDD